MEDQDSYLAPELEARRSSATHGRGVYATEDVPTGEVLAVWGGRIVDREELETLDPERRSLTLQVEEGLYLAPLGPPDPADLINHSCDPNAGLRGQVCLVSMRPIPAGKEVRFDYAMSEGSDYDEFPCRCGAEACRGRVTADDWRRPDLQERYEDYFSPYLARRIESLRRDGSP